MFPIQFLKHNKEFAIKANDQKLLQIYTLTGGTANQCYRFTYPQKQHQGMSDTAINNFFSQVLAHPQAEDYIAWVKVEFQNQVAKAKIKVTAKNSEEGAPTAKPATISIEEHQAKVKAKMDWMENRAIEIIGEQMDSSDADTAIDAAKVYFAKLRKEEDLQADFYPPMRILPEQCNPCLLRKFVIENCDIDCDICRYKLKCNEDGVEYNSKEQLDWSLKK